MPVRSVIFDFGGVLVRWKPIEVIAAFYADESVRPVIAREILQHPDWLEMDRGTLDDDTAIRRFSERAGRAVPEISAFLQHVRESLTPVPEMVELVRDLTTRGVPVYGLSNMASSTFDWLRSRYDLWDAFNGIVISAHIGMLKPEPQIFDYIAQRYSLSPAETVFIDDHRPNVEAAKALGFRTILCESSAQCLIELRQMLGA